MKRNICIGLIAFLLAGCLLAGCGKEAATEGEPEGTEVFSAEEPSAETSSAGASSAETSSAEAVSGSFSGAVADVPPEETDPFVPSLPTEELLEESFPPPEEQHLYLPAAGAIRQTKDENRLCTFTYEGNTMTVVKTYEDGREERDEYRFDDRGHVLEHTSLTRYGDYDDVYKDTYAYDGEGRMTRYATFSEGNGVDVYHDYFYGEDGRLCRDDYHGNHPATTTYERSYDEAGEVIKLTEHLANGYTEEHFYENGREVRSSTTNDEGELYAAYAYDYDENGNLTRLRYRYHYEDSPTTEEYFYAEGRLAEVRRDDGTEVRTVRQVFYDAYGRPVETKSGGSLRHFIAYGKNGMLCRVTDYQEDRDGRRELYRTLEVTDWGDEAVTETQLAFCRVAMYHLFGRMDLGMDGFYDVQTPKP